MDVNPQESRTNKRKLQDALESLDDAVNSTSTVDRPPPPKRQNTIKSLYSTLAKYGIRTKAEEYPKESPQSPDLSKTPRLAAILSRAGTKTRKVLPFTRRPTTRVTSDYRPSSTSSFLVRLETYKLNTYSNKPPEIDAVAASKCGWVNEGKDRLQCGLCGASWVVAGRDKMSRDAANALVKKQQAQLIDNHKDGCPWKARQCDPDVYRIQLSSPAGMAKDIKSRALRLTPLLENVEIKHPLLQSQTQSLEKTIASVHLDEFVFSPDAEASSNEASLSTAPEPSFPAVLAALFGWSIAPPMPAPSRPISRSGTPSLSRAGSVAPSAPSTPRRSSVLPQDHSYTPTCGPSSASLTSPTLARVNTRLLQTPRATPTPEQQSGMLYCSLCHRRLGLWAFGSSSTSPAINIPVSVNRQVDVLKEHRPYCPYVTRSTVLPTLPVSRDQPGPGSSTASLTSMASTVPGISSGPVEGWRAVLLVVLRYRMSQRHWDNLLNGLARRADGHTDQADNAQDEDVPTEADPVDAMVADVKKKGGRELLSYVKGLLG